jgi:hypothetical protein
MEGADRQVEKALKECENGKIGNSRRAESSTRLRRIRDYGEPSQDGFKSPFIIPIGGKGPKDAGKEAG